MGNLVVCGLFVVGFCWCYFYMTVFRIQGTLSPLVVGVFSLFLYTFDVDFVGILSQKVKSKN